VLKISKENPVVITYLTTSSIVPGRLALYKAIAKYRDPTGKISIKSLVSGTPSDFRGLGGTTLYFTPTLKVAEHYSTRVRFIVNRTEDRCRDACAFYRPG
jgi:hypothetical protein